MVLALSVGTKGDSTVTANDSQRNLSSGKMLVMTHRLIPASVHTCCYHFSVWVLRLRCVLVKSVAPISLMVMIDALTCGNNHRPSPYIAGCLKVERGHRKSLCRNLSEKIKPMGRFCAPDEIDILPLDRRRGLGRMSYVVCTDIEY